MNNQKTLHTLISPNSADAFSPSVVKTIVTSNVDFDIPDDIWDAIDAAFAHYWNEEVGYGSYIYPDEACSSVVTQLHKKGIIYPFNRIDKIVNTILDWALQIPGVFLDESEVVIPHKFNLNKITDTE